MRIFMVQSIIQISSSIIFFTYNLFLDIKKNRSFLIYCYIFHLSQRKFSESSNMGSTNYGGWVGKYGDDYSSDPTFHLVMVKV